MSARRSRRSGAPVPALILLAILSLLLLVLAGFLYSELRHSLDMAKTAAAAAQTRQDELDLAREELAAARQALEESGADKEALQARVDELEGEVKDLQTRLTIALSTPSPLPTPTPVPKTLPSALSPGDVVDREQLQDDLSLYFTAEAIDRDGEVFARINGKSYRDNPNMALEDLRYLRLLHYNFDHEIQSGEMIVNGKIAEDVLAIFRELFDAEYEVQSVYLIDNYWTGDATETDSASIDENNTSAFNYRESTASKNLSRHAYGMAIDINPLQNPYLWLSGGRYRYAHDNAAPYVDRTVDDPHIIKKGDLCYSTFEKYGFTWGGNWTNPIDYQHFEKKG